MSARVVVTNYTFPDVARERAAAETAGATFAAFQVRSDAEAAEMVAGAEVVAVLSRLNALGFRFIVADPGLTAEQAQRLGASLVDADELLASADILSLHAPATEQTTHFFNAARLSQMQSHAMIVNSARDQLIVDDDLAAALNEGIFATAALDVFHVEPLPADSALRTAPNLLLTPHAVWYSDAVIDRLQWLVATDTTRALNGEEPQRPVKL